MYIYIYIIYRYIYTHSCNYLKKTSSKTNLATDEGNSPNETSH